MNQTLKSFWNTPWECKSIYEWNTNSHFKLKLQVISGWFQVDIWDDFKLISGCFPVDFRFVSSWYKVVFRWRLMLKSSWFPVDFRFVSGWYKVVFRWRLMLKYSWNTPWECKSISKFNISSYLKLRQVTHSSICCKIGKLYFKQSSLFYIYWTLRFSLHWNGTRIKCKFWWVVLPIDGTWNQQSQPCHHMDIRKRSIANI